MGKLWWSFWKNETSNSNNKENDFWNSKKWEILKTSIKIEVEKNVTKIKSQNPDLYAYAILPGVDYEMDNIVSAFNKLSDIKKDETYYKYSVDEWKNYDTETLQSLNPLLSEIKNDFIKVYPEKREDLYLTTAEMKLIKKFHRTILLSLKELKEESSLFSFNSGEGFITIWFSDSDSEIIWESVAELNSKEITEEFNKEFK